MMKNIRSGTNISIQASWRPFFLAYLIITLAPSCYCEDDSEDGWSNADEEFWGKPTHPSRMSTGAAVAIALAVFFLFTGYCCCCSATKCKVEIAICRCISEWMVAFYKGCRRTCKCIYECFSVSYQCIYSCFCVSCSSRRERRESTSSIDSDTQEPLNRAPLADMAETVSLGTNGTPSETDSHPPAVPSAPPVPPPAYLTSDPLPSPPAFLSRRIRGPIGELYFDPAFSRRHNQPRAEPTAPPPSPSARRIREPLGHISMDPASSRRDNRPRTVPTGPPPPPAMDDRTEPPSYAEALDPMFDITPANIRGSGMSLNVGQILAAPSYETVV